MTLDIGTGDGRAVLARAQREPETLVIGLDASAASMAEASRRAERTRRANALFLVVAAEGLPGTPLVATADLATVTFPWGSLLRGMLGRDEASLRGVASVLRPGGRLRVLTSVIESDGIEGPVLNATAEAAIRSAWAEVGLDLQAMCVATAGEVRASDSTWARRLTASGNGPARPVWRLTARRSRSR